MPERDRITELDAAACRALLASRHVGRIAVNATGGPEIFPVNYVFDGTYRPSSRHPLGSGAIVFRTDPGTKLDAAVRGTEVTFEIDDIDEAHRVGWSVVVRGRVTEVTDPRHLARLRQLPLDPFAGGRKAHHVLLEPSRVSGRRIPLPDDVPLEWLRSRDLGPRVLGVDADDLGLS